MTAPADASQARLTDEELLAAKVARPRRTGQWVAAAVAAVLLAMLVHTVLTNPRFQWDVVRQFDPRALGHLHRMPFGCAAS